MIKDENILKRKIFEEKNKKGIGEVIMWGDIVIAFLLAFITAFVITPHTMRWAKKVGAIDLPNDRRVNKKPMPRLRRFGSYCRFLCISYLLTYYDEF